jgi:hypothetical protein
MQPFHCAAIVFVLALSSLASGEDLLGYPTLHCQDHVPP